MPLSVSKPGRTDLLQGTADALPAVHPLGLTPLHGPPRHAHLVIIVGVGPGMGLAIAEAFASQGYATVIMSRNLDRLNKWAEDLDRKARQRLQQDGERPDEGERLSRAVACDVLSTESIKRALTEGLACFPTRKLGTVVYNASVRKKSPFLDQTDEQLRDSLQASVVSAFAFFQGSIKEMLSGQGGSILATGATSATRGREGFAAFSSGKTGLRRLCETAAREFGPDGIHVAHVIVDGLIDSDTARRFLLGDDAVNGGQRFPDASVVLPAEAAKSYVFLAQQQSSAWTFELDLRPAKEHF